MTEKRFEMIITDMDGNFYYLDKITNEKIKSTLTLENKLNELNDENEQLKSELKALRKKYNDFSDAVDKRLQEMYKGV